MADNCSLLWIALRGFADGFLAAVVLFVMFAASKIGERAIKAWREGLTRTKPPESMRWWREGPTRTNVKPPSDSPVPPPPSPVRLAGGRRVRIKPETDFVAEPTPEWFIKLWRADDYAIEVVATAIYEAMPYDGPGTKPQWVTGGNSLRQQDARLRALAALTNLKSADRGGQDG
jgi:hypothetical protein